MQSDGVILSATIIATDFMNLRHEESLERFASAAPPLFCSMFALPLKTFSKHENKRPRPPRIMKARRRESK